MSAAEKPDAAAKPAPPATRMKNVAFAYGPAYTALARVPEQWGCDITNEYILQRARVGDLILVKSGTGVTALVGQPMIRHWSEQNKAGTATTAGADPKPTG